MAIAIGTAAGHAAFDVVRLRLRGIRNRVAWGSTGALEMSWLIPTSFRTLFPELQEPDQLDRAKRRGPFGSA
ncbi:MAG: hypothetical protein DMF87_06625 [Acidobacteria bacterium]|nr:MAG: hypothetical protein DMF87_06625 [Acidobacteriota bacterium]